MTDPTTLIRLILLSPFIVSALVMLAAIRANFLVSRRERSIR